MVPDDVLAGILRRVAPRDLAASRCACKAWRRVIDERRLLRADLLPCSLGGIFFNYLDLYFTQFLSRPTTGAAVSGRLDYTVPGKPDCMPDLHVQDHCNGLLLLDHCVVNPATQQWAPLPLSPDMPQTLPPGMISGPRQYLVFDPTLSPNHFEVLEMIHLPTKLSYYDGCVEESEWPPSTLILSVFSSKSASWEETTFVREGEAAGTVPAMVGSCRVFFHHQCAYWRGALYISCSDCFVMRISLSNHKYQVIRLPTEIQLPMEDASFYLGKSINGIYCASLFERSQLQVWFLNDPCVDGQTQWVLKHDTNMYSILPNMIVDEHHNGPWILQEIFYWRSEHSLQDIYGDSAVEHNREAIVEQQFEWDSDNDNVLEPGSRSKDRSVVFLGFHPYKEVVSLSDKFDRVLAYNWSRSKLQDLGKIFPKFYMDWHLHFYNTYVAEAFPYTPCWLGELPEKLNLDTQLQD